LKISVGSCVPALYKKITRTRN